MTDGAERTEKPDQAEHKEDKPADHQRGTVGMKKQHPPGKHIVAIISLVLHRVISIFFQIRFNQTNLQRINIILE